MPDGAENVLTEDAVDFLTRLQRQFGPRRTELLDGATRARGTAAPGRAAGLPPGDEERPRGRLAGRARAGGDPGPARRDHGSGRPEDGDQRPQLRRQDVHGRLRGLQLADLAELHRRPGESHRCPRADDHPRYRREAVLAERRDRDAARAPARLAPRGAALRGRRRADLGQPVRLRPLLLPQPRRAGGALLLPAEARVAPRGAALERRLRLGAGSSSASRAGRSRRRS